MVMVDESKLELVLVVVFSNLDGLSKSKVVSLGKGY